ncbi:MAG: Lrp/AsnC ligand binding domain-containing protein [Candidatus Methanomethylicaceae archaeon]|nr:Lrp/AsnC ligand binding domain-containing protein [Candidatus Verstraetearchaeota archaeon]
MKAFIEIKITPGSLESVLEAIKKIEGVKEAYPVTGHCDIMAIIEASDIKVLGNIITKCIHIIRGVESTETLLCVE